MAVPFRPWAIAAILLAGVAAFGPGLTSGFTSDDLHLIVERLPDYRRDFPLREAFTQGFWKGGGYGSLPGEEKDYYRPLVTLSYAADARIWGERPFGYHLTNLVLHLAAGLLVLQLLRRLGVSRGPALGGALLFTAHPVHVTNVTWISGRTDLLCAVLLLAAYELLAGSIDRRAGAATGRAPAGRTASGLALYILALLAKEMAIVLGGLLALHVLLRRARGRHPWTEVAAVAGVTVAYFAFRATVLGLPDFAAGARSAEAPFRPGMLPAILLWYWRGFLLPGTLQLVVPYAPVRTVGDPRLLMGAALLGGHVALAVLGLRRGRAAGLAAGWIVVSLIPVSHLVPLTFRAFVAEYWAYIPSIGFVALLASGLPWLAERLSERSSPGASEPPAADHERGSREASRGRGGPGAPPASRRRGAPSRAPALILVALAAGSVVYTPLRARPLRSEEALLRHQIRSNPRDAESWVTLAAEYGTRGEIGRAFEAAREAARIDPQLPGVHLGLGNLHDLAGQPDSAEAAYRRELRNHPERGEAAVSLADLRLRRGDFEEGKRLYGEALAGGTISASRMAEKADVLLGSALGGAPPPWPQREQELLLATGLLACLGDLGLPVPERQRIALVEAELRLGRIGAAASAARSAAAGPSFGPLLGALSDSPGGIDAAAREWAGDPGAAADGRSWAEFYHATGRTGLALPLWRALLRAGAMSADQLNHVAATAMKEEPGPSHDEAERILLMILEEQPGYPHALLNLGGLAYGRRDRAGCERWWGRFLALHAGRPEAEAVRERLAVTRTW